VQLHSLPESEDTDSLLPLARRQEVVGGGTRRGDEGGGSEQTVGGGRGEGIGVDVEVGRRRHHNVHETMRHTMHGTSQEVGTFFANRRRRLQLQVRDVTVAVAARVLLTRCLDSKVCFFLVLDSVTSTPIIFLQDHNVLYTLCRAFETKKSSGKRNIGLRLWHPHATT